MIFNDEGLFINADQVLGRTTYLDSLYKTDWKNKVEASGLSNIGFSDVDCIYKYYNFVVLYGRKSLKS